MKNILTLLLFPVLTGVIPHAESAEIILWIEKDVAADNQVTFTPYAKALRAFNLRYTLDVDKQGKSGRSSTRQSGKLLLQPNQPKAISTSSFNLKADDHYRINFKLFDKNKLVAELVSETPDNLP
ncbi:Thin aggregative fimbriae synthesis protein [Nitrosomonas marina]|uniref:Curli assembly protein CsgC n=1 Tax=Nitrosomonas marina TaxID=917 RepID=A0A1I0BEA8_9PROT|nr:curli-like amyloid fiber formation chaperone CsgH [Nitrosomonas marina]SET04525.1 Thin aggregative fimbriae synthesis protein [Nitrosomonas marina]